MGLTLDELGDVTRLKTNRTVSVLRDLSPEQFQQHLRRANEPGRRYIINFSRKEIFGAGQAITLRSEGIWRLRTWSSSWT